MAGAFEQIGPIPNSTQSSAGTAKKNQKNGPGVIKDDLEPWPAWLSWSGCCPMNRKVTGLISGQGTSLGCMLGPWSGGPCVHEAPDLFLSHIDDPPPAFLPSFLPL